MKRSSLQFEMSLKISIFFIVFIFAVTSAIIIYMSNEYNKIIVGNINDNMEKTVESVDSYFEDVKTPIVMLARNNDILNAMKKYQNMTNKEKLNTVNSLEDFVQNITTFKSFINDIIIVGNNGYLYNLYNKNQDKYLNDFNFIESSYLEKASMGPVKLYYLGQHPTEYYLHENTREDVYSVVLPVRSGNSKTGYIICDIKAEALNNILQGCLLNDRSKILILDENNKVVYESGNEELTAQELTANSDSGSQGTYDKNLWEILFARGNYITRIDSKMTGWTYIYAEPYENFNGFVKKIFLMNILIILVGITAIIFLSRELSAKILNPLKNIVYMIGEMRINQGLENYYPKSRNINELGLEIEHMIEKMDRLINDNYIYELKAKDARIQILVSQLSPHFLYNTLQLIEYQSYTDNKENVTRIINGLSYILRYAINSQNTVFLKEEIDYIRYYLDIYSLRYKEKLGYEITGEKEVLEQAIVPKMILEPVVGNCLKHGFSGNFNNALIKILIIKEDNNLIIKIWDNGKGIGEQKLQELRRGLEKIEVLEEHIGLNNTNSIIKLRYGDEYGIEIQSRENEYTEVTLKIPLTYESDRLNVHGGSGDEKGIAGR